VAAGGDPGAFWGLSPRELAMQMDGLRRRAEIAHEGRAWLAWHTAAIPMMKHPPKRPADLLPRRKAAVQTAEQMRAALLAWASVTERMP